MTYENGGERITNIFKSLGLVFGDIGTSPIYTFYIIFLTVPITTANILGILSLIIWTLTLLVFVQYAFLAMSLGKKGEGGTIVLKELLLPLLQSKKSIGFASLIAFIGISLLFGDGVITPAMSILSAIEGIRAISYFKDVSQTVLLCMASFIAIVIFSSQKKGPDKVAAAFGPLMFIWFIILAVSGIASLLTAPFVLKAINPYYAFTFMIENKFIAFFGLSGVILCATGGEALYADMGHLGRKPIIDASGFVFVSLVLTYLGQAAHLINHPHAGYVLYDMIYTQAPFFYMPFLLLSLATTIIASQAMISGIFSIVYQGIITNIFPVLKVDYTSRKLRSQIYIGFVNWFLFFAGVAIMFHFRTTPKIAAAYGFAVSGTMTITSIMMTWVFILKRHYFKAIIASCLVILNLMFFCSNSFKIPAGGYWSLILAVMLLSIIFVYIKGTQAVSTALKQLELERFLNKYREMYKRSTHLEGTALFLTKDVNHIEPYILQTIFKNNILYEDNIIISITTRDNSFGIIGFFKGDLAPGLRVFEIHVGYMEIINIEKILHNAGINAKVIFYGITEIITKNPLWKVYAAIKRITPGIAHFYRLPTYKLHGVITLVEL